jgi:hypothetical protein
LKKKLPSRIAAALTKSQRRLPEKIATVARGGMSDNEPPVKVCWNAAVSAHPISATAAINHPLKQSILKIPFFRGSN